MARHLKLVVGAALVLVLGGGATWLGGSAEGRRRREETRLAQLEAEVTNLRAVSPGRGRPGSGPGLTIMFAPPAASSPSPGGAGATAALSPAEAHAATRPEEWERVALERDRTRFAAYEEQLRAEPVDRAWREATERELTGTFAAAGLADRLALETVECRSSWCAVDVADGSGQLGDDAVRRAVRQWLTRQPCGFHLPSPRFAEGQQRPVHRLYVDCPARRR